MHSLENRIDDPYNKITVPNDALAVLDAWGARQRSILWKIGLVILIIRIAIPNDGFHTGRMGCSAPMPGHCNLLLPKYLATRRQFGKESVI
jgi:hypothetical protein